MRKWVEVLEDRRLLTTLPSGFAEALVVEGLHSPTAMEVAPDGRIFVCEQEGKLRVVKDGKLLPTPFVTVDTNDRGERGLVGVTLDPKFSSNHYVYVYYTAGQSTANRISRFTADGDRAAAGSEKVLYQLDASGGEASIHQGGALHFGPDGKLYAATGDHGGHARAQQLTNQVGKILRLNPDGSIPTDNPFYSQTTGKSRAIWALGLRNPFTFAFQPGTGRMFINDVGETKWEEINPGRAGANYGWPEVQGAAGDPRFVDPVYTYPHANGARAVVGGTFYNPPTGAAARFPSEYVGKYLFMDFGQRQIFRLDPATRAVTPFSGKIVGQGVDLDVGGDGSLYYLTRSIQDVNAAGIYRIRYTASSAPSIGTQPKSQTVPVGQSATFSVSASGAQPLGYQWQRNGVNIAGATAASYTLRSPALADSGAQFRVVVTNGAGRATSNAATLTVTSNRAPAATIASPAQGTHYSGGSVITFSGTGTDPEDGALPASAYTWEVVFHHDTHTHPFVAPFTGAKTGTFTVPRTGELSANVWYRVRLTVTDSRGLTHSTFRDVVPNTATMTLATSVPGLGLRLDDQPVATPLSVRGVAGMTRRLSAPATQVLNGVTYRFVSWSDGGAATHDIPFPSSSRTYTANYRAATGTMKTLSPSADAYVRDGSDAGTNFGSAGQLNVKASNGPGFNRWGYLKFDLSSLANVATAKLRLFGRLGGDDGASVTTGVFAADDTAWSESGLTWNNKPTPADAALATARVQSSAARWYEFDLTDYLRRQKAAGKASVALVLRNPSPTSAYVSFNSREATTNRPQLVVTG